MSEPVHLAAPSTPPPEVAAAPEPASREARLDRELARMRGREAAWAEERVRLLDALAAAEREVAELPALRHELKASRDAAYWLAVTRASWSWKLGAPVRAAAALMRRARRRSA